MNIAQLSLVEYYLVITLWTLLSYHSLHITQLSLNEHSSLITPYT
jgi:hypothetical protein